MGKHEITRIQSEVRGELAGPLSREKGLALRLKDSTARAELESRVNDPTTNIRDLAGLQRGIWSFVLRFDSDTSTSQIDQERPLEGLTKETFGAGLVALFASLLAGMILPINIKDPYKRHEGNKLVRSERDELRREMARIHALVTQKLVERKYWGDAYNELVDPPGPANH